MRTWRAGALTKCVVLLGPWVGVFCRQFDAVCPGVIKELSFHAVVSLVLLPRPHIRLEPCAVVVGGLFSASLLSVSPRFRAGSAMAVSHPPRAECPSVTSVKDINQGQARSRTRPCVSVLPSAAKLSFLDHCLSSKNQYHASHTVWFPTLHEAGRDGSG